MSFRLMFLFLFALALSNAASPFKSGAIIHTCGKKLADALSAVCLGKYAGFSKRSEVPMRYENDLKYTEGKEPMSDSRWSIYPKVLKRVQGLHDECCIHSCSLSTLETYCG